MEHQTDGDIATLSVTALKALITSAGLSYAGCVEKSDLRERAAEAWAVEAARARRALRTRETPGSFQGETPCSFQRASEEKLRSRRIVSVADRFRRSAAATRPTPGGDGSRSTSTDAQPSLPGNA